MLISLNLLVFMLPWPCRCKRWPGWGILEVFCFLLYSCALIISHGLCETTVCQHALGVLELLVIVSLECSLRQELFEVWIFCSDLGAAQHGGMACFLFCSLFMVTWVSHVYDGSQESRRIRMLTQVGS